MQDLQDFVQYLASLTRKVLARYDYLLQERFNWVSDESRYVQTATFKNHVGIASFTPLTYRSSDIIVDIWLVNLV